MSETCHCGQPAREWVTYVSVATGKQNGEREPMCVEHVQQELRLGADNLSMVVVELERIR